MKRKNKKSVEPTRKEHHVWCNFFNPALWENGKYRYDIDNPDECESCDGLYRSYPDNISEEELQKKYFPNVRKVKYEEKK